MDGNELKELRELVEFLKANDIAEFDMERADLKVRLKFAGAPIAAVPPGFDATQLTQLLAASGHAAPITTLPTPVAHVHAVEAAVPAQVPAEKLHLVKSPIVGTFYESPSPGSPAFVKVGDIIEVGQVLCIVEAMKLMNEIESDIAGELVERVGVTGQPVEYGQTLFTVRGR